MKVIKIIGHPVLLMSIFLLLIIEGENFGGIYLIYLLFALPHALPYAIFALLGLVSVCFGLGLNILKQPIVKSILYLLGITQMILSLILFFNKGNKNETFHQAIPLISFLLFALITLCFIINAICILKRYRTDKLTNIELII